MANERVNLKLVKQTWNYREEFNPYKVKSAEFLTAGSPKTYKKKELSFF